MSRTWRAVWLLAALWGAQTGALAWGDSGHRVVAQIAYLKLTSAAKANVDRLLVTPPDKRALIFYADKTYDPITIASWMDDFRGDSLNDSYSPWHYTNYKPLFDGTPERVALGPEPVNILDRLYWCINTLRKGSTGRDKTDAELLGFLFHLVGDSHQPLHATTRYTPQHPDGDAGGNLFLIEMPPDTRVKNLHSYWDGAAGLFGFNPIPRDAAGAERIREFANRLMRENPDASMPDSKQLDPHAWIEESNALARQYAYANIREGQTPSQAYADAAKKISGRRIALAGYRLAGILNSVYTQPPATKGKG